MDKRTHVWLHAQNGISDDEARRVLASIKKSPFGPMEVWRSDTPGAPRTLFLSFDGDVQQSVQAQLSELTNLPFTVEVMANQQP